MTKVKILTDSCSDLTGTLMDRYGIDYCQMKTVYNEVQSPANLRWSDTEVHDFYEILRSGERITTTQVPVEEYKTVFTKYLELGYDIVYIGCALKQSGSVNTAGVVAKNLLEKYPKHKIFCIDSLNATIGEGMLAIEAAKLCADGSRSADEIKEWVLAHRKNVLEYATVHSLDALKRAGRVKASSAFFGNLMGVKPILIADADGNQAAFKKVKGRQTSFKEIVNLLKVNIVNAEKQTVYIAHADCSEEELNQLTSLVKEEIKPAAIETVYIGPIIGASVGPDTIGVWGFGNEVTWKAGE